MKQPFQSIRNCWQRGTKGNESRSHLPHINTFPLGFCLLPQTPEKGYSGFFRGFDLLLRSLLASLSPEKNLRVFYRSKRQKVICYTDRQLQQAKFICKPWSLLVSELQLTAPANAGVQKAESVCKPWRLSVSELHTYFVEKKEVHRICCRSHSQGSASFAVSERPQLASPKADLFGRPLQHYI